MTDMIRLVYASRANFESAPDGISIEPTVARILLQSRRNNVGRAIGGVLYYGDGYFLQCLEGPRDAVEALADKIKRDPRHSDFRVLKKQAVDARLFSDWSMKFVVLESEVDDLLRGFDLAEFDPTLFDDRIIDELIQLFATAQQADVGDEAAESAPETAPRRSGLVAWLRRLFD